MKNETAIEELKKEIGRIRRKSTEKNIVLIIFALLVVGVSAIYIILKFRDKLSFLADNEESDELDDYISYSDDEDCYEDYRALDYEDIEDENL